MRGFLIASLVTVVGCAEQPDGMLRGKVTFDGDPVTSAVVVFAYPDGKRAESRPTRKDGTYEMHHAPTGKVQVHLTAKEGGGPLKSKTGKKLPEKYLSPTESGLTAAVEGGKQRLDLDLTK